MSSHSKTRKRNARGKIKNPEKAAPQHRSKGTEMMSAKDIDELKHRREMQRLRQAALEARKKGDLERECIIKMTTKQTSIDRLERQQQQLEIELKAIRGNKGKRQVQAKSRKRRTDFATHQFQSACFLPETSTDVPETVQHSVPQQVEHLTKFALLCQAAGTARDKETVNLLEQQ